MIIKIEFEDGIVMMFGDSYKKWWDQADEYMWLYKKELAKIKEVSQSKSKWIGWGGLKWCSEDKFQEQLNREGCQSNDHDNKNPRKYTSMEFVKVSEKIFEQVGILYQQAKRSI